MTFTSVTFLIFFPIAVIAYFLVPKKARMIWLLFCSYFFYICQSAAMPVYLVIATVVTYAAARMMGKKIVDPGDADDIGDRDGGGLSGSRSVILWVSTAVLIGALGVFKYVDLSSVGLFMPIGISFFTFQSLSYIIDVYKGKISPERNFVKVALYVSFFPAILAGPIQRGASFMPQLSEHHDFDAERVKCGLIYMLWGYFLKIVISGRLTILTTQVFGGYMNYSGSMLLVAALLYAFLIYCDFAGYSYIAIGAGRILGYGLGVNFRQPYLSGSIGEFWRRWHISLSSWFRDYLYIPLGGSKKGTLRKYLNVVIVFAVSGIWHGNTMNFLIWGLLNGFYQVAGQVLKPVRTALASLIRLNRKPALARVLSIIGSFVLLDIAWIFFAIPDFGDAISVLSKIFTQFSGADLFNGTLFTLGLGRMNLAFALFALAILIVMDIICEVKKCDVMEFIPTLRTWMRWAFYYALILMILMSVNLSTAEFIYSKF